MLHEGMRGEIASQSSSTGSVFGPSCNGKGSLCKNNHSGLLILIWETVALVSVAISAEIPGFIWMISCALGLE